MHDPVLIVGAGPVGLLNALGLAQAGVPVVVLEAEAAVVNEPRALVYHWSVLAGLDRLGVLRDMEQMGFCKQDYLYYVHKTKERISFSLDVLTGHTPYPYNVHLGQHKLAEIAAAHLARFPHATIRWGARVTGLVQDADGVTVSTDEVDGPQDYRGSWLIGADGGRSAVRKALGLGFEGFTWPERFVSTNVYYDFEKYDFARATFAVDDKYGGIIVKIDEAGLWRVTYSESASLPEETIGERLPDYFKARLPGDEGYELVEYAPYRMHQRSAERYRVGRVLLAGDAAHSTNPTGGLGLTSGLFDTYVLYEALAAVVQGDAPQSVLDDYAQQRRRMFLDVASPQAQASKLVVFQSGDPDKLEADLTVLRRLASDADFRLERSLFTRRLETPSLIGTA